MFDPMFDLIANLMAWFYSLVPSVGLAIIMLTLVAVSYTHLPLPTTPYV